MPQIFKPQNTLEQLSAYLSKVPPVGDFATLNAITPFATYVDSFYPGKGFTTKMDKIQKIAQSLGDPNLENSICPNMNQYDPNMQNAIRAITDKVTNYTDGNDLSTLIRESLRMQFVTAVENIVPDKRDVNPNAHIEPLMNGVNSSMLVSVLASLDTLQLVDNQMTKFKTASLNNVTGLVSIISQTAPQLVPTLLDIINLTESYFQLANIVKEMVAVAKMNEQPASQMTNNGAGMIQDMSKIIPISNGNKNIKMSAAQTSQAIQDISSMITEASIVNINGQNTYSVNKELIDSILYTYATDDDLVDLQSLANGQDVMRNPLDMYNTIVAYNNAQPVENQDLMIQNPWYQMMLLTVARLQGQAIAQTQNNDLMMSTADVYNSISLYAKIQIVGNQTNIEECLRTDISMASKLSTLCMSAALGNNTSLTNFANNFLGVGANGVSKLAPDVMINGIKATNAAFQPNRVQPRDIEHWLGLSGVASSMMPDTTIKDEVVGSLTNIIREYRI